MAGVYYKNGSSFTQIAASDIGAAASSHSHSAATTSAAGFMSAADKIKLNGIATGANAYTLPTASSTLGGVKTTSTVTSTSGLTACPIISGVPYYKDTNTTYTLSSLGAAASSHNHAASAITSGTLAVARGGTGVTTTAAIGLMAYPVGSVYIAYNSTSPASRLGRQAGAGA